MAKAADIPLHPDMAFADAAALTVAVRAQELFAHADGVLDTGEIERVHDMRVATRRLRAVLEIFASCFARDEHRAVLAEVKRLADALGERRDPDVQLEALASIEEVMAPEDLPGLAAFSERVRADQARGNEHLAEALRLVEERDLQGRLKALVAEGP